MLRWPRSPRLLVYLVLGFALCLSLLPPAPALAQTPVQQASTPQTLNFVNGVAVVQGTTGFNQPQVYLFFGAQGQNINVRLSSQPGGANFEVASQDNNTVYKSFADPSLDWSYVLPASQNYRVTVNSVTAVIFTLTVTLGGGGGGGGQRISFAPGQTMAQVSGTAGFGQSPQYVFFANGGQQVRIVLISAGNIANFSVTGATDGIAYKSPADPSRDWTFTLPTSQDYQITVTAASTVSFTLQVYLLGPQPPQAERINFAPGQSTQVVSGNLQANVPKYYIVNVAAGQQLRLLLTSNPAGSANFAINGVTDGVVYKQLTDPAREVTITAPTSQDYLITLFSSVNASYQLEVTVPTPLPPTTQSPTLTPLPTLPSGCTSNTIQNGNFESDGFWIFGDTQAKPAYSSTVVRSGLRSVRLGIDPNMGAAFQNVKSFSSVRQPFQIPIEATIAQLRWWSYNSTQEAQTDNPGLGQDKQEVVLLKPDLSTVAVVSSVRRNNNAWIEQLVDLTPYRGQSLVLYFNVYNDGNGQLTWQYLDDVAINVCFPAVTPTPIIPTPIPLPTAIPSPLILTVVSQAAFPTSPAVATFVATAFPTLAALASPMGKGEPDVVVLPPGQAAAVAAAVQPSPTFTPPLPVATATTAATTQGGLRIFNRPVAEVLTWLGIMLGALAVIGILAVLIWQASQRDETVP